MLFFKIFGLNWLKLLHAIQMKFVDKTIIVKSKNSINRLKSFIENIQYPSYSLYPQFNVKFYRQKLIENLETNSWDGKTSKSNEETAREK